METDILTLEQNRNWNKNGYIVLRNVLSQQEIKNLTTVVDQMYQEYLQQYPESGGILHTDGGQAMRQIRVSQSSLPLQIKIQYFLTDLEEEDKGNFTIVPGSHNRPFPDGGFKDGPYIPEAIQLRVRAGDAVVFPHALWHGFVANKSKNSRKTLVYCYVHQCLRAFDYYDVSDELMGRCTPRQRRLIGDIGEWQPGSYFYSPPDQVQMIESVTDR